MEYKENIEQRKANCDSNNIGDLVVLLHNKIVIDATGFDNIDSNFVLSELNNMDITVSEDEAKLITEGVNLRLKHDRETHNFK